MTRLIAIAHPDNKDALQKMATKLAIPAETDANCPKEVWHPPEGDRLVKYTPADRLWAEPLGLGSVGPVVYVIDMSHYTLDLDFPAMPITPPKYEPPKLEYFVQFMRYRW